MLICPSCVIFLSNTSLPSLASVYEVVTFYAQFTLNPNGKYAIAVCLGTACYVKGSGKILERFDQKLGISAGGITPDGKYSLDATRCIGACGLAPVLTVNGKETMPLRMDDGKVAFRVIADRYGLEVFDLSGVSYGAVEAVPSGDTLTFGGEGSLDRLIVREVK